MSSAASALPAKELQPLPEGTQLQSALGKCYAINAVLQQRQHGDMLFSVYRASHEGKRYILKVIRPKIFEAQLSLQKLVKSAHVRTAVDNIPDHNLLVYPFLEANLFSVKTTAIPPAYIKPNNIMLDINKEGNLTLSPRNIQITDLEDAYAIPPDMDGIKWRTYGNHFWRSPESWAKAFQNTSSDIFSFGLVAIYAWLDIMVLYSDEANKALPEEQSKMILRRHLSYFANYKGDPGDFLDYYDEKDPFVERMLDLFENFDAEANMAMPFFTWSEIDVQFKDLIGKMTRLDPRQRITAREALQHPWFADCGKD